ncbi:predicted protein [Plenodomus lingam JN3]|uniref:Predicted protein n=1 Tax=Leptosphaeria maculans (strain JN3 / isolate v23.1.3 / race Av1-4-5-6-7-8) TaxID=985895 RepID=E4ZT80_LEPMJ|nr:predicted protein [Plenodomus lingam JN3]CBX90022.1 predicted protein [Plenodomus lingam JN3]
MAGAPAARHVTPPAQQRLAAPAGLATPPPTRRAVGSTRIPVRPRRYRFRRGVHAGKTLAECPAEYVRWCVAHRRAFARAEHRALHRELDDYERAYRREVDLVGDGEVDDGDVDDGDVGDNKAHHDDDDDDDDMGVQLPTSPMVPAPASPQPPTPPRPAPRQWRVRNWAAGWLGATPCRPPRPTPSSPPPPPPPPPLDHARLVELHNHRVVERITRAHDEQLRDAMGGVRMLTQHVALAAADQTVHRLAAHMNSQTESADASFKDMTARLHAADTDSVTRHGSLMEATQETHQAMQQAIDLSRTWMQQSTDERQAIQHSANTTRQAMEQAATELSAQRTAIDRLQNTLREDLVREFESLRRTLLSRSPSPSRGRSTSQRQRVDDGDTGQPGISTRDQELASSLDYVHGMTKRLRDGHSLDRRRQYNREIAAMQAQVDAAKLDIIALQNNANLSDLDRASLIRRFRDSQHTIQEQERRLKELRQMNDVSRKERQASAKDYDRLRLERDRTGTRWRDGQDTIEAMGEQLHKLQQMGDVSRKDRQASAKDYDRLRHELDRAGRRHNTHQMDLPRSGLALWRVQQAAVPRSQTAFTRPETGLRLDEEEVEDVS